MRAASGGQARGSADPLEQEAASETGGGATVGWMEGLLVVDVGRPVCGDVQIHLRAPAELLDAAGARMRRRLRRAAAADAGSSSDTGSESDESNVGAWSDDDPGIGPSSGAGSSRAQGGGSAGRAVGGGPRLKKKSSRYRDSHGVSTDGLLARFALHTSMLPSGQLEVIPLREDHVDIFRADLVPARDFEMNLILRAAPGDLLAEMEQ